MMFKFTVFAVFMSFLLLGYANFSIMWEMNEGGPSFFEFLDIGSFLFNFIFKGYAFAIDDKFGISFFYPVTSYIVGSITYLLCYLASFWLAGYILVFGDFNTGEEGFYFHLFMMAIIIAFYYFHVLDFLPFFKAFSIPNHNTTIASYFWISVVVSVYMKYKSCF